MDKDKKIKDHNLFRIKFHFHFGKVFRNISFRFLEKFYER